MNRIDCPIAKREAHRELKRDRVLPQNCHLGATVNYHSKHVRELTYKYLDTQGIVWIARGKTR